MARRVKDLGPVLAQPQQLWRLHLGRDAPADIAQDVVPARIDARRLVDRAVVHPDDDVAVGMGGVAHAQGRIAHHHQRTGGVEPDACHAGRVDPGLGHRGAGRGADRVPDLRAGLFGDHPVGAVHGDVAFPGAKRGARGVEHARPRRSGADVDADQVPVHQRHSRPI